MEVRSYWLLLFAAKRFLSVMEKQLAFFLLKWTTPSIVALLTQSCVSVRASSIFMLERPSENRQQLKQSAAPCSCFHSITQVDLLEHTHTHTCAHSQRMHTHPSLGISKAGRGWRLIYLTNVWSRCFCFITPIMIQHLLLPACVISGRAPLAPRERLHSDDLWRRAARRCWHAAEPIPLCPFI